MEFELMEILKVPKSLSLKNRTMRLMLYTLFGLVVADGLITEFLVTNGHASEVNPFLQAWVGHDSFLAIKVSGAFLATLLLWIKYNTNPKLIYIFTGGLLTIYTSIVFMSLFTFLVIRL